MNRKGCAALTGCLLLVFNWGCDGSPTGPPSVRPTPTALPTPSPTATSTATPLAGCEYEPPVIYEPTNGATVSGRITIRVGVPEYPCINSASTFVSVVDAADAVVFTGCAVLEDYPRWDTTKVPNGVYRIRTQRSCACRASAICDRLGGPVHVMVLNPAPSF